jgi:AcrR family transcriptional regulator
MTTIFIARSPTRNLIARACADKNEIVSSSTTHRRAAKSRNYRLGRRAALQEATRRRIVEAAVELHCTLGPARTTVSQIAERAGVQRHTYYAHFPDERSLFLACSALALERGPLPDFEQLLAIPPGRDRVRRGLELVFAWYADNEDHAACVIRDSETHALTREMVELRIAPAFTRVAELIGDGLGERARSLLQLALDFACWRTLKASCDVRQAAALMSDAIAALA